MDRENSRQIRMRVFEDTKEACENHPILMDAIYWSSAKQKMISEDESVDCSKVICREQAAKIVVSKKRSFEAAMGYPEDKVCVLNFASATSPGGGVVHGAAAQEECLCRCSTLYPNLHQSEMWDSFYSPHRRWLQNGRMSALYNADCIFTPGVVIFKSDTEFPEILPEEEWKTVDIITCAAPNLRSRFNTSNLFWGQEEMKISDDVLKTLHEKRFRKILDIAKANQEEVVILGAFGCGAFCNPPEIVASAAKEILREYQKYFKVIEFAVYCSRWDRKNYEVFRSILIGDKEIDENEDFNCGGHAK